MIIDVTGLAMITQSLNQRKMSGLLNIGLPLAVILILFAGLGKELISRLSLNVLAIRTLHEFSVTAFESVHPLLINAIELDKCQYNPSGSPMKLELVRAPSAASARPDANALLGATYWMLGDKASAIEAWKRAHAGVFFRIAAENESVRSTDRNIVLMEQYAWLSTVINPKDAAGWYMLGLAGIELHRDSSMVLYQLITAHRLGTYGYAPARLIVDFYTYFSEPRDYDSGLLWLEEAYRMGMPTWEYHFLRGDALYGKKDYASAILELRMALATADQPKIDVLQVLGAVQLESGDFEGAAYTYGLIMSSWPNAFEYRLEQARAWRLAGDGDAATVVCQQLFRDCPDCASQDWLEKEDGIWVCPNLP